MERFGAGWGALPVALAGFGVFPGAPAVVWAAPALTGELLARRAAPALTGELLARRAAQVATVPEAPVPRASPARASGAARDAGPGGSP